MKVFNACRVPKTGIRKECAAAAGFSQGGVPTGIRKVSVIPSKPHHNLMDIVFKIGTKDDINPNVYAITHRRVMILDMASSTHLRNWMAVLREVRSVL